MNNKLFLYIVSLSLINAPALFAMNNHYNQDTCKKDLKNKMFDSGDFTKQLITQLIIRNNDRKNKIEQQILHYKKLHDEREKTYCLLRDVNQIHLKTEKNIDFKKLKSLLKYNKALEYKHENEIEYANLLKTENDALRKKLYILEKENEKMEFVIENNKQVLEQTEPVVSVKKIKKAAGCCMGIYLLLLGICGFSLHASS